MPDRERSGNVETPWTEKQWELFMRRSEARAAKFGEILETVKDHPDRDAIIDREMGWDREDEGYDDAEPSWMQSHDAEVDAVAEAFEPGPPAAEPDEADEALVMAARRRDRLHQDVPAYSLAYETGLRVHEALRPFMREHDGRDDEVAERLGEAFIHSLIPAAKIAGGHAMGYDDEVLCGNIVCNRIALDSTERSLDAIRWLRDRGVLPIDVAGTLLDGMIAVQHAISERIRELRQRVWW